MSHKQLVEMARRNLAHAKAGTVDQAPDVFRVPATHYFERERWQLEMDRVFKRLPVVLAFSAELREPGAYRAMEAAGVPVLITRGEDGEARVFMNVCSHRGAIVVPEGVGNAQNFQCPYHAWTYNARGDLISIFNPKTFGDVDRSCLGLTPLPCAERAGLIFATLSPDAWFDIDAFLCGYGELLEHHHFDDCHVVGRQAIEGPNWKVAYDGYLDFYHLPILHRESFGPNMPNQALFDAWGPHQRVSMPNPGFAALEDKPEEDWDPGALIGGVWTIFPHISIADFDAGGKMYMVSQLFPGATPDDSITIQNFLTTSEPDDARKETIAGVMKFLEHVVRNEDYYTGNRIQRAVKTGAKTEFLFGKNESGGHRFHRWVEALVQTDDRELPGLLRSGIDS